MLYIPKLILLFPLYHSMYSWMFMCLFDVMIHQVSIIKFSFNSFTHSIWKLMLWVMCLIWPLTFTMHLRYVGIIHFAFDVLQLLSNNKFTQMNFNTSTNIELKTRPFEREWELDISYANLGFLSSLESLAHKPLHSLHIYASFRH